jgi:lysophospholipase L1-like esterase
MRNRFFTLAVFVTLSGLAFSSAAPAQIYYVALGDSLSVGYQPINGGGPTNQGYVDDHAVAMTILPIVCVVSTS